MTSRNAHIILNLLPGIGPVKLQQLVLALGSPERIFSASMKELCAVPGVGTKLAEILFHWENYCQPEKEIKMAQAAGVYLITREDSAYPPLLKEIHDAPICLYVRGNLKALESCRQSIAIVGSRHTTTYGVQMATSLASGAAYAGFTVVSGLARGIDTEAHKATIRAGGCTIAVIGSGLCRLYPPENRGLAEDIVNSGGAVISEFPLNMLPDKRNFPMRNRIISGLSRGTLVVEAGLESGSLITAAAATDQNRTVFAVPGRADTPYSRGCHNLLRDGARLVESFQDILDEFSLLPNIRINAVEREQKERAQLCVSLSPMEYSVWEKVSEEEIPIDDVLASCVEPPSKVLGTLLMLEMKQVIRQLPGKQVSRIPGRKVECISS